LYRYKNELRKEDKVNLNILVGRQKHKLVRAFKPFLECCDNFLLLSFETAKTIFGLLIAGYA